MPNKSCSEFNICDYQKEGLYVILPDSTCLELTKDNIEKEAKKFWEDPSKITPKIKKAIDFQKCSYCPRKAKSDICDAIRPVLPFLEIVDKYVSFDEATALYRGKEGLLYSKRTTMQEALKYVSILSLTYYHQTNRKYWKYYYGIIPLMGGKEAASRMYLNMYWLHKGNIEEINKVIERFTSELRESSSNQVKRLNLVCKNDAFMNAFVSTQIATEFLSMNIDEALTKAVETFGKEAADSGYIPTSILSQ